MESNVGFLVGVLGTLERRGMNVRFHFFQSPFQHLNYINNTYIFNTMLVTRHYVSNVFNPYKLSNLRLIPSLSFLHVDF